MKTIERFRSFVPKSIKNPFFVAIILSFTMGCLLTFSVCSTMNQATLTFPFMSRSIQRETTNALPVGLNSTHAWSMQFANENHFRLARLVSCRTVIYKGGPKNDTIDSCDQSPNKEFSIQSTIQAQKWLYEHQHPISCTDKRFAIITSYAWSGFGSTMHQVLWAFAEAVRQNRIAVYTIPGNWLYGYCNSSTPECYFLPISNCSVPSNVDNNQTIRISANVWHWHTPILPPPFRNRTLNWYRAQLLLYVMRYKPEALAYAQNTIAQYFKPPSLDFHRPYIAVYVRRSDKVSSGEMSRAYTLKQYFDLFDDDARRANITSVYINSEDPTVFDEFPQINKAKNNFYSLLTINVTRGLTMYAFLKNITNESRTKFVLEFLTDLYIEAHADLHVGTLSSNWCRMVDGFRLALGKTVTFYTPENNFLMDWEDTHTKKIFFPKT